MTASLHTLSFLLAALVLTSAALPVAAQDTAERSQWQPSWGGGLEGGFFFTHFDRWNTHVLRRNDASPLDVAGAVHVDLAVEAAWLEGTRLALFGGLASPYHDDPSVLALYICLEPALAFRGGDWELAIGLGAALGGANLELEAGPSMDANLVVLRPFLEVRNHPAESLAAYLRFGFNQWIVVNATSDALELTTLAGRPLTADDLSEGGIYAALGIRFGHYPEHVARSPDTEPPTGGEYAPDDKVEPE